ncbi:MAG: hypothetical protein LBR65_02400 [Culturomica sp.]|jgi:hypothetical protein|nr:hypothetical protein [Culturomica sp.]
MNAVPYLLMFCGTVFLIVMTAAYYLVPSRIIERKSEYVKFALMFLSTYAVIFSVVYCLCIPIAVLLCWLFFPALFGAYMLWPFRDGRRNQHIAFFLFWPALASLPILLLLSMSFFSRNVTVF